MSVCVICQSKCQPFYQDKRRDYLHCDNCGCVQVPSSQHLSESAEKAIYDTHNNDPTDEGYLRFLGRAALPLLERLTHPSVGLDFGCGPGPALKNLLETAGHRVCLYDKFYFPNKDVLAQSYHFITLTEVIEHLADPVAVLTQLWSLLQRNGWLVIMTKRVSNREAFSRWHYINDPTHITFFHQDTFEFLANQLHAELEVVGPDVVLLRKKQ